MLSRVKTLFVKNNKPDVIYLDLDGVLVNLVPHIYRLFGLENVQKGYLETTEWDAMHRVLSIQENQMWEKINNAGEEFWATAPWTDDGKEIYSLCNRIAPTVIMSTPTRHPSCAAGKISWINKNLPEVRRYALTPCKHHFAKRNALLVDDSPSNIKNFKEHGGKTITVKQPWNNGVNPIPILKTFL